LASDHPQRKRRKFRQLNQFHTAPKLFPPLENPYYLTKVREWAKASCKASGDSIVC
jgi:hypothetical protein